jgi:hypothetical protein
MATPESGFRTWKLGEHVTVETEGRKPTRDNAKTTKQNTRLMILKPAITYRKSVLRKLRFYPQFLLVTSFTQIFSELVTDARRNPRRSVTGARF